MKIFNLGMSKTGTCTLQLALQILGFKAHHNHKEVVKGFVDHKEGREQQILGNILRDHDAITESCYWNGYWRALYRTYPQAKFIYTYRDLDGWINSALIDVLYSRVTGSSDWRDISTTGLKKTFLENREVVFKFFSTRQDQFLPINILGGQGWATLCDFLNRDIPNVPFPHCNGSTRKLEQIWMKKRNGSLSAAS